MTTPTRGCGPGRRRRAVIGALAALVILAIVGPQMWAWYWLRAGRAKLDRYHPEEAQADLSAALKVWPNRSSVRLLASRAARQSGDFIGAEEHLRRAMHAAGGATRETAFEWALGQAAAGNVWEVDEYLHRRAGEDPSQATLAWEALATGYLRRYQTIDAMACLDHWLQVHPDDVRALDLRGMTFETGSGVQRGAEDYRRALQLDPERTQTRWRLAQSLIDLGGYEEAAGHLERLTQEMPGDQDVLVNLARCRNILGRAEEARRLLDDVLGRHPGHPSALRARGQFAMAERDPAEAERWLRAAAAAAPNDYQAHWQLSQALQQQGKAAEAAAQLKVAEDVKDRIERLGELRSRKLAEQPLNPALHYEMGELMVQTGRPDLGEWWLKSALSLDPNLEPAHAALAELYERAGDTALAAEHRRKVNQ